MTDKARIDAAIDWAKQWADENEDVTTGLDDDCEEVNVYCLRIEDVKTLLDLLRQRLLDDDTKAELPSQNDALRHLRECPYCHGKKVLPVVKHGDWGYYPASAYIECEDCGLRSKEFEGKDDSDESGALRKAIAAWNRRC